MAAEERKAIVSAHNALELMLEWDRKRDFIVPYKVRDPINAALKQLREVIATPGVAASLQAKALSDPPEVIAAEFDRTVARADGVPASELTEQAAYDMGAKGAQATERERLLFEAWMRGHCWALCATWDGKQYVSDAEQGGDLDPRAMATRRLFAAWRDRAALGVPASQEALPNVPPGKWKVDMPDGLYTEMPGDPPGPCDLRKVIGGYVYFVTPRSGKLVALNPPRNAGVPASAVKWCPECRSAGVVGIEQDVCPTCNGTGKVADGVAMPWKPPPYPATPTEREALAKRRAALGVKEGS